ncbi:RIBONUCLEASE III [Salix purpurea]|uniref:RIBONUCLEASE III n=1 Tax=Salix purpurea TaxID=77065 RepID=A0A9Q0WW26_SALPP|nr:RIBONUCLEASE III [Salix purpurea]
MTFLSPADPIHEQRTITRTPSSASSRSSSSMYITIAPAAFASAARGHLCLCRAAAAFASAARGRLCIMHSTQPHTPLKVNREKPTYNSVQLPGSLPVFTSTLVFDGVSYTGDAGRNKKEAEQLATRTVILSILGLPNNLMYKNPLQEYTQKSSLQLPVYQTFNKRPAHMPRAAAAFASAARGHGQRASLLMQSSSRFCICGPRASLHNALHTTTHALKVNREKPTYNSVQLPGSLPVFTSTLVFDGVSYTGLPNNLMYKNRLQDYTQKSSLQLPRHPLTADAKAAASLYNAEQQPLLHLRPEGMARASRYAAASLCICGPRLKVNREKPTYNSVQLPGSLPVFTSTLVFDGVSYTGDAGRNKKEV